MMHSSVRRALQKKQAQSNIDSDQQADSSNQAPQRYLPRLELSKTGQTEPVCPYCQMNLDQMPQETCNCPNCGEEIIVMKRPKDKAVVLVNDQEAEQLNNEWEAYNERRDPYLREKGAHAINLEYSDLWDKLGREPTLQEIKASFLKKDNTKQETRHADG